jgi:hypothetical protein
MHLTAEARDADRDVGNCATRRSPEELTRPNIIDLCLRDEIDERLANAQRETHKGLRSIPQNCASLKTTPRRGPLEFA